MLAAAGTRCRLASWQRLRVLTSVFVGSRASVAAFSSSSSSSGGPFHSQTSLLARNFPLGPTYPEAPNEATQRWTVDQKQQLETYFPGLRFNDVTDGVKVAYSSLVRAINEQDTDALRSMCAPDLANAIIKAIKSRSPYPQRATTPVPRPHTGGDTLVSWWSVSRSWLPDAWLSAFFSMPQPLTDDWLVHVKAQPNVSDALIDVAHESLRAFLFTPFDPVSHTNPCFTGVPDTPRGVQPNHISLRIQMLCSSGLLFSPALSLATFNSGMQKSVKLFQTLAQLSMHMTFTALPPSELCMEKLQSHFAAACKDNAKGIEALSSGHAAEQVAAEASGMALDNDMLQREPITDTLATAKAELESLMDNFGAYNQPSDPFARLATAILYFHNPTACTAALQLSAACVSELEAIRSSVGDVSALDSPLIFPLLGLFAGVDSVAHAAAWSALPVAAWLSYLIGSSADRIAQASALAQVLGVWEKSPKAAVEALGKFWLQHDGGAAWRRSMLHIYDLGGSQGGATERLKFFPPPILAQWGSLEWHDELPSMQHANILERMCALHFKTGKAPAVLASPCATLEEVRSHYGDDEHIERPTPAQKLRLPKGFEETLHRGRIGEAMHAHMHMRKRVQGLIFRHCSDPRDPLPHLVGAPPEVDYMRDLLDHFDPWQDYSDAERFVAERAKEAEWTADPKPTNVPLLARIVWRLTGTNTFRPMDSLDLLKKKVDQSSAMQEAQLSGKNDVKNDGRSTPESDHEARLRRLGARRTVSSGDLNHPYYHSACELRKKLLGERLLIGQPFERLTPMEEEWTRKLGHMHFFDYEIQGTRFRKMSMRDIFESEGEYLRFRHRYGLLSILLSLPGFLNETAWNVIATVLTASPAKALHYNTMMARAEMMEEQVFGDLHDSQRAIPDERIRFGLGALLPQTNEGFAPVVIPAPFALPPAMGSMPRGPIASFFGRRFDTTVRLRAVHRQFLATVTDIMMQIHGQFPDDANRTRSSGLSSKYLRRMRQLKTIKSFPEAVDYWLDTVPLHPQAVKAFLPLEWQAAQSHNGAARAQRISRIHPSAFLTDSDVPLREPAVSPYVATARRDKFPEAPWNFEGRLRDVSFQQFRLRSENDMFDSSSRESVDQAVLDAMNVNLDAEVGLQALEEYFLRDSEGDVIEGHENNLLIGRRWVFETVLKNRGKKLEPDWVLKELSRMPE